MYYSVIIYDITRIFRELFFCRLGESFDTCIYNVKLNFANFILQMDPDSENYENFMTMKFQSYSMPPARALQTFQVLRITEKETSKITGERD